MSSYKSVPHEVTVEDALDLIPFQDLRDEMQEWIDNMSGTGLENTNRYEMAEEAVSQLENADSIDFNTIWEAIAENYPVKAEELKALKLTTYIYTPKSKKQYPSRAYRLSNGITSIKDALETIRDYLAEKELTDKDGTKDILDAMDEIESQLDDLDSVDFPGMFG